MRRRAACARSLLGLCWRFRIAGDHGYWTIHCRACGTRLTAWMASLDDYCFNCACVSGVATFHLAGDNPTIRPCGGYYACRASLLPPVLRPPVPRS